MRVLYLGVSGTMHPSASTYELVHGRSPWDCGHRQYEAAPWLTNALEAWPQVRIILTSTQPWSLGLGPVLQRLGSGLAPKVLGFTYEDLTTKLRRGRRQLPLSDADYWRCNKSEIVRLHVSWLQPSAWVAVDDEAILWTTEEREQHLVAVDGCKGLLDPAAQDRLLTVMEGNFGPPTMA